MSDDTTIPLPGPCRLEKQEHGELYSLFYRVDRLTSFAIAEDIPAEYARAFADAMNAAQATVPPSRGDGALGELAELSAKATQGEWEGLSEPYDSVPWLHGYGGDGKHLGHRDRTWEEKLANTKLAFALVNAYRSGKLVEAPTTHPGAAGQAASGSGGASAWKVVDAYGTAERAVATAATSSREIFDKALALREETRAALLKHMLAAAPTPSATASDALTINATAPQPPAPIAPVAPASGDMEEIERLVDALSLATISECVLAFGEDEEGDGALERAALRKKKLRADLLTAIRSRLAAASSAREDALEEAARAIEATRAGSFHRDAILEAAVRRIRALKADPTPGAPATASSGAAVEVSVEEVERLVEALYAHIPDDASQECEDLLAAIRSLAAQQDKDGVREALEPLWQRARAPGADKVSDDAPVTVFMRDCREAARALGMVVPGGVAARALKTAATADQPGRVLFTVDTPSGPKDYPRPKPGREGAKLVSHDRAKTVRRILEIVEEDEDGVRVWPDSFEIADAIREAFPAPLTPPSPAPRQVAAPQPDAHHHREQGRDTTEQEDGRRDR